jgi:hypothetical protein
MLDVLNAYTHWTSVSQFIISSKRRESHQPQVIQASHTNSKILVPGRARTPNLSHCRQTITAYRDTCRWNTNNTHIMVSGWMVVRRCAEHEDSESSPDNQHQGVGRKHTSNHFGPHWKTSNTRIGLISCWHHAYILKLLTSIYTLTHHGLPVMQRLIKTGMKRQWPYWPVSSQDVNRPEHRLSAMSIS